MAGWKTQCNYGSVFTSTYFNSCACTSQQKLGALRVHQQALVSSDAWRPLSRPLHIFARCHIPICQGHNQRQRRSPSMLSQRINERKGTFTHTVDRHWPIPTLMLTHNVSVCRARKYWAWCGGCSVEERARMCSAQSQQTVNITGGENGIRRPNCLWRGFMF